MDRELSLIEHLSELRKRIIACLVSLGIGSMLGLPFASRILKFLKLPAAGLIGKFAFFSPQEPFLIYMRIAVVLGLIISMPVILYQLWAFVSPALEERTKRYSGSFILFCFTAFLAGAAFAYFLLMPPALKFLLNFGREDLEPVISASKYISFALSLILSCGLVFQMPILSFIFTKLGVINAQALRKRYKYAVAAILIVAAAITPTTDVFNMLILAVPMLFLYEISIWISFFAQPKHKAIA